MCLNNKGPIFRKFQEDTPHLLLIGNIMIHMVGYRICIKDRLIIDSYPQAAKYFGNMNVFSAVLRIAAYLMSDMRRYK